MNTTNEATQGKYLAFFTDDQLFGISIVDVVQIIGVEEIVAVPEFPSFVKGVINLRGNIIPVIDIRARFQKEHREYDERTCTIITSINGVLTGIIVDSVSSVMDISDESISLPPNISQNTSYLKGIARVSGKVILILECSKIVSNELLEDFSHIESYL